MYQYVSLFLSLSLLEVSSWCTDSQPQDAGGVPATCSDLTVDAQCTFPSCSAGMSMSFLVYHFRLRENRRQHSHLSVKWLLDVCCCLYVILFVLS